MHIGIQMIRSENAWCAGAVRWPSRLVERLMDKSTMIRDTVSNPQRKATIATSQLAYCSLLSQPYHLLPQDGAAVFLPAPISKVQSSMQGIERPDDRAVERL